MHTCCDYLLALVKQPIRQLMVLSLHCSFNPWHACGARVTLVVCLSRLKLLSRMFIRLANDTTHLAGSEDPLFCAIFSENAPLQS